MVQTVQGSRGVLIIQKIREMGGPYVPFPGDTAMNTREKALYESRELPSTGGNTGWEKNLEATFYNRFTCHNPPFELISRLKMTPIPSLNTPLTVNDSNVLWEKEEKHVKQMLSDLNAGCF